MKSLIVTADDFGYSRAVNEAVILAYRRGILRYASLMVDGEAAREAVAAAKENPGLGVGLHLDLCRENPAAWGMRYCFWPSHRRRLEPEIARQLEKFKAFGLKPSHVDGHLNIHVHPVIFPILARLSREHGIPRVRLPAGEAALSLAFDRSRALSRLGLAGVFGTLGACLRRAGAGLEIPPRTYGLLRSGLMREDYLLWLISRLPEGRTEIYFHPSSDPGSAVTDTPTPTHHTISELESLLSPRAAAALRRAGVTLAAEPAAAASSD